MLCTAQSLLEKSGTVEAVRAASTESASGPVSIFDMVKHPVVTTVDVTASVSDAASPEPAPFEISALEMLTTAGSYGDMLRSLQVLPGVESSNDMTNEVLVRGGHPIENLYLVDGVEIPNINHLALPGTTGGFAAMIDTGAVQGLKLFTGGYDADFPERLSSVTEITLLDARHAERIIEGDLGIEGVGGVVEQRLYGGDLLFSAHHGLLDVVTSDVGMNGVPSYSNALMRFRRNDHAGNQLTLLNVMGADSIAVNPCASDIDETSSINSQFSGWRMTTGAAWQHVYSPRAFALITASDSEQVDHIHQQDQAPDPLHATLVPAECPLPASLVHTTPIYMEDTNNAFSTAGYRYEFATADITISSGVEVWLQRPHLNVAQPIGAYSPFSASPGRFDSTSFRADFSTGETGSFAQFTYRTHGLVVGAGGRVQTFAFGGHTTLTPRASIRYQIGHRLGMHAAFGRYAQIPPYIYMLAFPQNHALRPMRATHEIVGLDLHIAESTQLRVEAYSKQYADTPAATEYPTVTLHNMPDLLTDEIVWLPMTSQGYGEASGIELSGNTRATSRALIQGSLAYARAKFAGTDKVLRPSNYDLPWIFNLAGNLTLARGWVGSARWGYAAGRPYTPYDIPASLAQNRPIYDVSRVNAVRAPYYARLDALLTREIRIKGSRLELYGGVNNILNRNNFLSYAWMPLWNTFPGAKIPVKELDQMPIFPNFGVRWIVR